MPANVPQNNQVFDNQADLAEVNQDNLKAFNDFQNQSVGTKNMQEWIKQHIQPTVSFEANEDQDPEKMLELGQDLMNKLNNNSSPSINNFEEDAGLEENDSNSLNNLPTPKPGKKNEEDEQNEAGAGEKAGREMGKEVGGQMGEEGGRAVGNSVLPGVGGEVGAKIGREVGERVGADIGGKMGAQGDQQLSMTQNFDSSGNMTGFSVTGPRNMVQKFKNMFASEQAESDLSMNNRAANKPR